MLKSDPTPVRTGRHQVQAALVATSNLLIGEPGLTKMQQLERLQEAVNLLGGAVQVLGEMAILIADRDEEAHAAEKAEYQVLADAVNEALQGDDDES